MNKIKKNGILAMAGLFMVMMAATSVSATEEDEPGVLDRVDITTDTAPDDNMDDTTSNEDEPNLISPNTDADGEPLIIAPAGNSEYEDTVPEDNSFTTGLLLVMGLSGLVSLGVALIIFKNKN